MPTRFKKRSDDSDYSKGYMDGLQDAYDSSELDAYYTGVGYGKKESGDKHIGFNSEKEREMFEQGVSQKDNHFRAWRVERPTFLERLIGIKDHRKRERKLKRKKARTNKMREKIRNRGVVRRKKQRELFVNRTSKKMLKNVRKNSIKENNKTKEMVLRK